MTPRRWTRAATVSLACAVTSVTFTLAPAAAEPYPWHNQSDHPVSGSVRVNKAQVEHRERVAAEPGTGPVMDRPQAQTPTAGATWSLGGSADLAVRAGQPGWWVSAGVPEPVLVERSGTLLVGDVEVEVYNGTPGLERLIAWSFAQFQAHGLGTPNVHRVTFHTKSINTCQGVNGLILGDAVILCFNSAAACMDQDCTDWMTWTKKTTLHELAHAWIDEHVTTEVIDRFRTATAAPTWSDQAHAWGERGVELAAETIAWATADQPVRVNLKLRPRSCHELARDYEILTGRPPEPTPPGCKPIPPARPRSLTHPR